MLRLQLSSHSKCSIGKNRLKQIVISSISSANGHLNAVEKQSKHVVHDDYRWKSSSSAIFYDHRNNNDDREYNYNSDNKHEVNEEHRTSGPPPIRTQQDSERVKGWEMRLSHQEKERQTKRNQMLQKYGLQRDGWRTKMARENKILKGSGVAFNPSKLDLSLPNEPPPPRDATTFFKKTSSPSPPIPARPSIPRRKNPTTTYGNDRQRSNTYQEDPVPDLQSINRLAEVFIESNPYRNKRNTHDALKQQDERRTSLFSNTKNKTLPPKPFPKNPIMSRATKAWRTTKNSLRNIRDLENQKQAYEEKRQRFHPREQYTDPSETASIFSTLQSNPSMYSPSQNTNTTKENNKVRLPAHAMSVRDISTLFRVKTATIVDLLFYLGEAPPPDQLEDSLISLDTMELIALELGLEPIRSDDTLKSVSEENLELLVKRRAADTDSLEPVESPTHAPRPPVVCVMGHVDHGKTTLMDALRQMSKSNSQAKEKKDQIGNIAGTEAGGITQAISAFQVSLPQHEEHETVTFLDTPGHAAFRAMRESGSHAADVIVLVIAADDGVSKQTDEIIEFYKSIVSQADGGISLVVAMTKIDKPEVDVKESRFRIENQLLERGIVSESMGMSQGEGIVGSPVQFVPVSGITGEGLNDLVESLVLQSQVMDLRADYTAKAEGIVMDARVDKGLGVIVDCIVRWGSLRRGDIVVSGVHSGKVKALKRMDTIDVKEALPSHPVRILGLKSLPKAGDPIIVAESEEEADKMIERRQVVASDTNNLRSVSTSRTELQVTGRNAKEYGSLQAIHEKFDRDENKNDEDEITENDEIHIPIVVKADTDGALSALYQSIVAIGDESKYNLVIDPIVTGIGPLSTSEAQMAQSSEAVIFSFNVHETDRDAIDLVESEGIVYKSNKVIYSLVEDAKHVFASFIPPSRTEHIHGTALVKQVFDINNGADKIAGLFVTDGRLYKDKAMIGVEEEGKKKKKKQQEQEQVDCAFRVYRNGTLITEEIKAKSLRKFKENVDEIQRGEECGLGLEDFTDLQEGDTVECVSIVMKHVFL